MKRALPSTTAMVLLVCGALQPAPTFAQVYAHETETVIVEGENALPGIWKFPPHERRSVWSELGNDIVAEFTAPGPEKYCRIGRAASGFTLNCLEIAERWPQARLDRERRVSLSWAVLFGVPGCRWIFRGRLETDTSITGHLGMICGMVLRERPEPMTITKMVLTERTPDVGGQSAFLRRLLEEMAEGPIAEPYAMPHIVSSDPAVKPLPDDAQQQLLKRLTPLTLRLLGNITAVIYVAQYAPIVGWRYSEASPVYSEKQSSIYAVEFENGERLCAIHRRKDGVLDRFQCI